MSTSGSFGVFPLPNVVIGSDDSRVAVDDQGRSIRQRRQHVKSRAGCVACKQRRVKCDEGRPTCGKCSSRNLPCRFETPAAGNQGPKTEVLRLRHRQDHSGPIMRRPGFGDVDMTAMRLMYHFEHVTSATLVFGTSIWRDQVLPLALQDRQLMSAVLMISASHLCYLQPAVVSNGRAAALYLDHTLADFRSSLEEPLETRNLDAMISCAFILLHYIWGTPSLSLDDDAAPNPALDKLIPFATGLKSVILRAMDIEGSPLAIFGPVLRPESIRRFKDWVSTVECSRDFREVFMRRSVVPTTVREADCLGICGSGHAADRLVPILQSIDAVSRGEDVAELMPDIQSYLFLWPAKADKTFEDEVGANKIESLIVMLAFYASMMWFLSDVWWAERRSKVMFKTILAYLERKAGREWRQCATEICEYFGINSITHPNLVTGT